MNDTIEQDTAAVTEVLQHLYGAWSAGDAEAFAALFREDATVVMPGLYHRGRSAVRDYMAAGFAGPLKESRAVDEPQDVRVIDANTAVIVSRSGIIMAGEQNLPADRERLATWVLSKQDGQWLIAAYTNTPAH